MTETLLPPLAAAPRSPRRRARGATLPALALELDAALRVHGLGSYGNMDAGAGPPAPATRPDISQVSLP